ncbi:MAG: NDP-sugar synthase [Syntrophomonadaceae bacterium]|nr:NDP-sugar synthase [Syntrophomonadaceae bacterium]
MIMAAGVGSRLMPMTAEVPKPMISLCNRPLMENSLRLLQRHGFDQVVANLHYLGQAISDYFGNGEDFGIELCYSHEKELWGTAGGVKRCAAFLDETFVVLSGDALTDIDLSALLRRHRRAGALASIALKPVEAVEEFGVVVLDAGERIKSFQEKPPRSEALSDLVNTGIYIFEPEIFEHIPAGEFYDFGLQVFPALIECGAPFYGFGIDDYWCDVGSLDTYRQAHDDILTGRVRVQPQGEVIASPWGRLLAGEGVRLGHEVVVKGSACVGAGSTIGEGVILENAVIWENSVIGPGAEIRDAIIGSGCHIGAQAVVGAW